MRRVLSSHPRFTLRSMSSSSSPHPPTTLPEALVKITQLESKLNSLALAVHQFSGLSLDELLEKHSQSLSSTSTPPTLPVTSNITSESNTPQLEVEGATTDIAPLILRALAIRKRIAIGEEGAASQVDVLCATPGLEESQKKMLREWAGVV